jgi:transposase
VSEVDNLYTAVLGLKAPWRVERVVTQLDAGEVHVTVALPTNTRWVCPECGAAAPIHDHQDRSWRHLDTCQFHTIVHARVPRLVDGHRYPRLSDHAVVTRPRDDSASC